MTRLALVVTAVLAMSSPARADEGESALSASLSYATFAIPDHSPSGGVLGVDYERGVTEALWLRGSVGAGLYREGGNVYSGHGVLGLTYALDVLKYVPYANLGVGALVVGGGEIDRDVYPLVEIGGGLDIHLSRDFSWGVLARFESFLDRSAYFTAGARISWRWGFF